MRTTSVPRGAAGQRFPRRRGPRSGRHGLVGCGQRGHLARLSALHGARRRRPVHPVERLRSVPRPDPRRRRDPRRLRPARRPRGDQPLPGAVGGAVGHGRPGQHRRRGHRRLPRWAGRRVLDVGDRVRRHGAQDDRGHPGHALPQPRRTANPHGGAMWVASRGWPPSIRGCAGSASPSAASSASRCSSPPSPAATCSRPGTWPTSPSSTSASRRWPPARSSPCSPRWSFSVASVESARSRAGWFRSCAGPTCWRV